MHTLTIFNKSKVVWVSLRNGFSICNTGCLKRVFVFSGWIIKALSTWTIQPSISGSNTKGVRQTLITISVSAYLDLLLKSILTKCRHLLVEK